MLHNANCWLSDHLHLLLHVHLRDAAHQSMADVLCCLQVLPKCQL
jgi:hypothetical protein